VAPISGWVTGVPHLPPGAAKSGNFGTKLRHYQPKSAQKRPKKGQNRLFVVTYQLTMYFCMLLIICALCYFYREKSDNNR
jgi:hypothetical protein